MGAQWLQGLYEPALCTGLWPWHALSPCLCCQTPGTDARTQNRLDDDPRGHFSWASAPVISPSDLRPRMKQLSCLAVVCAGNALMPAGSLCWPLLAFRGKWPRAMRWALETAGLGSNPDSITNFTSLSFGVFIYKMRVILLISELWLVQLNVLTYFKGLGIKQELHSSCLSLESLLIWLRRWSWQFALSSMSPEASISAHNNLG